MADRTPLIQKAGEIFQLPSGDRLVDPTGNVYHSATLACRLFNSVAIATVSGTSKRLTFDTELFDTDNMHDLVTNPSRLTCKTAGTYYIFGGIEYSLNTTGYRFISIRLNSTISYPASQASAPIPTLPTALGVSCIYKLAVNDYLELEILQNSGAALTITSSADYSPSFGMIWLGP